jgi:tetratricopeptide (TPR) repeat protein
VRNLLISVLVVAACGGGTSDKPAPAPKGAPAALDSAAAVAAPSTKFARPEAAIASGRKLVKDGKLAEAKAAFEAALALQADDPVALSELGYVELKLGNDAAALAITDRAIAAATEPKLEAASLYNRGRLLEKQADVEGAKAAYTESLALRPNATVQARLDELTGAGGAPSAAPANTGIATFKKAYQTVREVPWPAQGYRCGDDCTAKVLKTIYGDLDGDGADEAVVVVEGAFDIPGDQTAHLYGVRAGKVAWLGRVHTGGREHPEYAPQFIKAAIGGGKLDITWKYELWGNCDDPDDCRETVTETYRLAGGRAVDDAGEPTN